MGVVGCIWFGLRISLGVVVGLAEVDPLVKLVSDDFGRTMTLPGGMVGIPFIGGLVEVIGVCGPIRMAGGVIAFAGGVDGATRVDLIGCIFIGLRIGFGFLMILKLFGLLGST